MLVIPPFHSKLSGFYVLEVKKDGVEMVIFKSGKNTNFAKFR